ELLLRLHWVAILHGRVPIDLAVTGGVHTASDALKVLLAGGRVAMMTSALLRYGAEYVGRVLADLADWLREHEDESGAGMCGSMSLGGVADPSAYVRANYMKVLRSYALSDSSEP